MITESGMILTLESFRTLDPAVLTTEDVRNALMRIKRYSGHGISVYEHSVRLYRMAWRAGLSPDFQLACLLHDVGEMAGMIDIPSPEKHLPCWSAVVEIQEVFQQRVYTHFGLNLSTEDWARLHEWDKASAWMELLDVKYDVRETVKAAWVPEPRISHDFNLAWREERSKDFMSLPDWLDVIINWQKRSVRFGNTYNA